MGALRSPLFWCMLLLVVSGDGGVSALRDRAAQADATAPRALHSRRRSSGNTVRGRHLAPHVRQGLDADVPTITVTAADSRFALVSKSAAEVDANAIAVADASAFFTGLEIIIPTVLIVFAFIKLGLAISAYIIRSRNKWLRSAAADDLREVREESSKKLQAFADSFLVPNADMLLRFRETLASVAVDAVGAMKDEEINALAASAITKCSKILKLPNADTAVHTDKACDDLKRAAKTPKDAKPLLLAMLRLDFDDIGANDGKKNANYAVAGSVLCVMACSRLRMACACTYRDCKPRSRPFLSFPSVQHPAEGQRPSIVAVDAI